MAGNVLITGITGFAGSHLAELLMSKGMTVYGLQRWRSRQDNIRHISKRLKLIEANMLDLTSLKHAVRETEPDMVFHLAAQSFVPASWKAPSETMQVNVVGTVNLLEAIRDSKCDPVIQIAGTSEEYGLVRKDECPVTESNELRPLSPYAVSKVAADMLGFQYFKSYSMKCIRTRGFNHTGPRRGDVFVTSDFSKQIARIENDRQSPVINVGNLDAIRDFTDVRDMMRAYLMAAQKGEPGEIYNIGTGEGRVIRDVLDTLLKLTNRKVEVKIDQKRMRPSDVPVLVCDSTKIREKIGWKPEIPFEKTMADLLDYWRERIKGGSQ